MDKKEEAATDTAGQVVRIRCTRCSGSTNHIVLKSLDLTEVNEEDRYQFWTTYQIIRCQGCDTVSFRQLEYNSEDIDPYTGESVERQQLFPQRFDGRPMFSYDDLLPHQLESIYKETIAALNARNHILCGIGIRAVIETVAKDKNAAGSNLSQKIDNLVQQGLLTADGAKILHQIRTLGNEAAHEVKAHGSRKLNLAIDVLEHLLQAVYILPEHAKNTFK